MFEKFADIDSHSIKLIREVNTSLSGVELVHEVPDKSVELYQKHRVGNIFKLPLKVPSKEDIEYDQLMEQKRRNLQNQILMSVMQLPGLPVKIVIGMKLS